MHAIPHWFPFDLLVNFSVLIGGAGNYFLGVPKLESSYTVTVGMHRVLITIKRHAGPIWDNPEVTVTIETLV